MGRRTRVSVGSGEGPVEQIEPLPTPIERRKPQSEGAVVGPFRASGLCRTDMGWAVAVIEVDENGAVVNLEIGPSQKFPEIVAQQLVRTQMTLNQETLRRYPWRPG